VVEVVVTVVVRESMLHTENARSHTRDLPVERRVISRDRRNRTQYIDTASGRQNVAQQMAAPSTPKSEMRKLTHGQRAGRRQPVGRHLRVGRPPINRHQQA